MKDTPKHIRLLLSSEIDKLSEEAILAVFALASFEHTVSIALANDACKLVNQPSHKVFKMLASIELYDIEPLIIFSDEAMFESCTLPCQHKPLTDLPTFINSHQLSNDSSLVFWQV